MCSSGFCLVFFVAHVVFLMNYSEQQTTVGTENGVTPAKEFNVDDVMKGYILKFYKKRFVEGQNLVVAPLLIFRVFMSLYGEMDASAQFDLHSLAEIPQDAHVDKMDEIQKFANKYILPVDRSRVETRLYYDKTIGKVRESLAAKNLTLISTDFNDKKAFCNEVNGWIKNSPIKATDDLVHDYYLNNETDAFLAGALSIDWNMQLKPSISEKSFREENVKFLEGSISTKHVKLDDQKVEVVEMVNDKLSGVKLWLIMPDGASSIKEFNDQLTTASIRQIEERLTAQKGDVALTVPMVTIEYNSQEDAYVTEVFEVFSSLFTKPSVKLAEGREDLYAVKNFLMKCILRFVGSDAVADSKGKATEKTVAFDRPFVMMILSESNSVPILLANYFSPTDKLRALEAKERLLKARAQEHLDL